MDERVAEKYRKLMQDNFPHSGPMENPTMFIDTKAEGVSICGQGAKDFMNIYMSVSDGVISEVRYLCVCDPTANVLVEALCELAKGKTLEQAKNFSKEEFYEAIGCDNGLVRQKVWGTIELLKRVITRYENRDLLKTSGAPAAVSESEWEDEGDW